MGAFFLFAQFLDALHENYKSFFGKSSGGKKTKLSFKGYIIEAIEFYKDYKDALNDNFYNFVELIVIKRQMNDNSSV